MNDRFRWNEWNIEHIGHHAVSPDEAEYVVDHAAAPYPEQIGDGKWRARGQTAAGRYLQVIIHARSLTETEKRQLRRRLR